MTESKENKIIPTLGPWELSLVSVGDDISHAIAETTYPYKNGADIEDMGVNPETFKFSCILKNEDYDNNYFQLRNWFLSRFTEPIELFHPEHGTLYGYPKNVSFSNDRRKHFAEFNFDFEVSGIQLDVQAFTNPHDENLEEAQAINIATQESIATTMQQTGVPDIEDSSDWSLLDKWAAMGDDARNFAEATNKAMSKLLGVIEAVQAPIDAISTTIDYGRSLSGTLTAAIQKCCDSFVATARKAGSSSSKRSQSRSTIALLVANLTSMQTSLFVAPKSIQANFADVAAATVATETAKLIAEDGTQLGESISQERIMVDDAEGGKLSEPSEPYLLFPTDLEDTLAISREFIQRALPNSSKPESLKKMAATLSDAVLQVKMEYMTTKKIQVTSETPLHKIVTDNGMNYQAAERICALNNVKNPTFMKGEVLIYDK